MNICMSKLTVDVDKSKENKQITISASNFRSTKT